MKIKFFIVVFLVTSAVLLLFSGCATEQKEVEEFTIDLHSLRIKIGEVNVQFMRPLSPSLRSETAEVFYLPSEDAILLCYRLDFVNYYQFWSRNGRQHFLKALEQYNEDFTARNLPNNRKSKKAYGTVLGYLLWFPFQFAVQARANMDVDLGYQFRERVPYFTVNQGAAEYKNPNIPANDRTSTVIPMFFTRAQAAELALFFDQDFLIQIDVPELPPLRIPSVDRDDDY